MMLPFYRTMPLEYAEGHQWVSRWSYGHPWTRPWTVSVHGPYFEWVSK